MIEQKAGSEEDRYRQVFKSKEALPSDVAAVLQSEAKEEGKITKIPIPSKKN